MSNLLANLPGILAALLAFGVLILVHELGHLFAAKRSGVKVEEFWIGMGPVLFTRRIGETNYQLRLLPIGGACVMEGEDSEAVSPRSFGKASRPRRFAILIAGVVMNFITGFLILLCIPLPSMAGGELVTTRIDSFYEGFQHEGEDGLMAGDRILKIDGYRVLQRGDIDVGIQRGAADGRFDFVVERGGKNVQVSLAMEPNVLVDGKLRYGLHFGTQAVTLPLRLRETGLEAVNQARMIWLSLGDLVRGEVGVDQLSGPVGVTEVMAQTARQSMYSFLYLVAFISINLGVMNLLPIPGLDGGRLLFLLVEAVRRKPLSPKLEGYVNAAGLVLLFGLMIYVTGNDVLRLLS